MSGNIDQLLLPQSGAVKPSSLEQNTYEKELWATRITEVPSNMQLFSQNDTDGDPIYIGYAARGIASDQDGWLLQKFTYDGTKTISKRQIAYGNWDGRAGYTYS
jgi:hypothetical protein